MKYDKIYIVGYTKGYCYDYSDTEVFATQDINVANEWCKNFDDRIKKAKVDKVNPFLSFWDDDSEVFFNLPKYTIKHFIILKDIQGSFIREIALR